MSIFISNIHFDANEEDIAALLTSHGLQIRRVDLFRDRSTGNSRGVAVVDLEDPRDIENIIRSLQGLGLSLNGRAIFMKPNERRERRGEPPRNQVGTNQALQRPANQAGAQPNNPPPDPRTQHQVVEMQDHLQPQVWMDVPMEYRAQVQQRCQRQYFKDKVRSRGRTDTAVNHWINEWTAAAEHQFPFHHAGLRSIEVKIDWRLIANSGLDEGMIRPVIAAGGWPIIPGSSIKGLCRKACRHAGLDSNKMMSWFGNTEQAGIIRFHGAWPADSSWKKGLLDLTHPQQDWQLGKGRPSHSANVLVSLYKPTLLLCMSSRDPQINADTWGEIENTLRNALTLGIGGRTSAGYGHSGDDRSHDLIFSCCLEGRFPTPKLLDGRTEFRPIMFRAAIHGMALRLFAGLTSEKMAISAVDYLFGTLQSVDDRKPKEGLLALKFNPLSGSHSTEIVNGNEATAIAGVLEWMTTRPIEDDEKEQLQDLLAGLHGLVISLAGFGRSWRRPDHQLFYHRNDNYSKLIGCHWQWREANHLHAWIDVSSLDGLQTLVRRSRSLARQWLQQIKHLQDVPSPRWREVIHPDRMLIWCRKADSSKDARAIHWFHERPSANHQPWRNPDFRPALFRTDLAGRVFNRKIDHQQTLVGSIWNRMLPIIDEEAPHNDLPEFRLHPGRFLEILVLFKHPQIESTRHFSDLASYMDSSNSSFSAVDFR
jgi:CRISPR-associated protein Cmr6